MPVPPKTNPKLLALAIALAMMVFVADVWLSADIASGVPYVGIVLLTLWGMHRRVTLAIAAACTLLTILGSFFSYPVGQLGFDLGTRLVSIFAIWITAILLHQRKQVEVSLAIRAKQMETVRALSEEITRELNPTTLLELSIRRAVELIASAAVGVVMLWDDAEQVLTARAWYGLGKWIETVRIALGEGLTGLVAQRREGLLVNDYETSRFARPDLVPYIGPTAVLAEPLLYRGRLLGVISLGNAGSGQPFTEQDRELLALFAAQAAVAIENARLFKAVQDQADQLALTNAALRDREERYRAFVAQSSEGIWRFELERPMPIDLPEEEQLHHLYQYSYLAECNDVMARMYGFSAADQLIGIRIGDFLPLSHPESIAFHRTFIRAGYRLVDAESHEIDKQGHRKIFLNNIVGMVEHGCLIRTWGSQRDITDRRHLETRLLQTQKMAAIGTLAGGIAHDFNNILTAILGYTELALYDVSPDSKLYDYLQEVHIAGKRAKDLVQQILTFSRQSDQKPRAVRLYQLVQEALTMLRASLPTTIDIQPHLDPDVGPVMAEATQVHQIVMNLCANAGHAMRDTGGVLDVGLTQVKVGDEMAAIHPDLSPGDYVRLTVRDTGKGMSADIRERMFEPFFTTKPVGEGTGMGLAVVHGIVSRQHGMITVDSNPGRGTTVTIYFPCAPLDQETMANLDRDAPPGRGRVLLVDDEDSLARLGHVTLTQLGYDVTVYTDSLAALEAFRVNPQHFDVVITDQTMPHLTGELLAKELRRLRADIPVVLCTGYSHLIDAEKATIQGINAFLLKPFESQTLARTLQDVLCHRPPVTTG